MVTVFGFDRNGNFDSDFAGDGGFVYLDDYNELKCYVDQMESRLAELEKDASRYRWLKDGGINELQVAKRNGDDFISTGSYLDGEVDILMAMDEA